jgi:hypothetical protein
VWAIGVGEGWKDIRDGRGAASQARDAGLALGWECGEGIEEMKKHKFQKGGSVRNDSRGLYKYCVTHKKLCRAPVSAVARALKR